MTGIEMEQFCCFPSWLRIADSIFYFYFFLLKWKDHHLSYNLCAFITSERSFMGFIGRAPLSFWGFSVTVCDSFLFVAARIGVHVSEINCCVFLLSFSQLTHLKVGTCTYLRYSEFFCQCSELQFTGACVCPRWSYTEIM